MPLERSRLGPATDRSIRRAERRLTAADPIMKRLIGAHGHCPLAARQYALFHMLANSIAGLQRAASVLYGKKRRSENLLPRVAEAWRPYRSVASWYLWKSLERPDR